MASDTLEDRVLSLLRERGSLRLTELTSQIVAGAPAARVKELEGQTKREALRLIDEGRLQVGYDYKLRLASAE